MNGKTGEAGANGLLDALGDSEAGTGFFGEANKAADEWEEDFKDIMKQGGVDVDQIKDGTEGLVGDDGAEGDFTTFKGAVLNTLYGEGGTKDNPKDGSLNAGINAANEEIDTLGETAQDKFDTVSTSVSTWQKTYSPKVTKATSDTNALGQSVINLLDKNIEVIASVTGKTDVDDLANAIRNLSSKTVTVTSNHETNYKTNYSTTGDKPAAPANKPTTGGGGPQGDGIP
jgi:acylphosphatase